MKKLNEWEKKVIRSASVRIPPLTFSIDPELDHHLKEMGIGYTNDFNKFLEEQSGLKQKELQEKIKTYILKMAKIPTRNLSERYRKHMAEKILKESTNKDIKKRMEEYIQKKEWK